MSYIPTTSVNRPKLTKRVNKYETNENHFPKNVTSRYVSKTHKQSIQTIITDTDKQIMVELVIEHFEHDQVCRKKRFLHVDSKE